MTTLDQPTPAQILELLAELREARTKKLGLVRNGKRDLALTSLINELDNRVMEIPAATLRAHAAALASREAECERLRAALHDLQSAAHGMVVGISAHNRLHPDAPARRDDIRGPVVDALHQAAVNARQALTPTQEAPQ